MPDSNINPILQQAQKVYELRMELPDEATIPLYGEIAKMGMFDS